MLEAEHHIRIHGDEAAIAVIGEAAVAGQFGERFDGLVVEAEIEHGVHHARHRGAAAGTHRHQQRILGIAERLAGQLADMVERLLDLRLQFRRIGFVVGVEISADRGRDGEARRHRQAEIGHLGEVGALAAEQIAQARFALGLAVAEGVDPLAGFYRLDGRLAHRRLLGSLGAFCDLGDRLGRGLLQRLAGRGRRRRPWAARMALISLQISLQPSWTSRRLWPWHSNYPKEGRRLRALHHFGGFRASRETPLSRARSATS